MVKRSRKFRQYSKACEIVIRTLAPNVQPIQLLPFLESHGWMRAYAFEILLDVRERIMKEV